MDGVKERLISYLEYAGINKSEFGRRIGVSNAFVTSIRKSIQPNKIVAINKEFPDLDTNWLLTGEGEMLKGTDQVSKEKLIPFYDAETTGGFNGLVSSSDEGMLKGYIQPGGWFGGEETAAIRHVGDSMTEYPHGCILAVRQVNSKHLLVPGRNYVIETREYRVTKRVQSGRRPDTIMLYSTNTAKYDDGRLVHEPFEVSLEDVLHIYQVLGYIVNEYGECRLIKG